MNKINDVFELDKKIQRDLERTLEIDSQSINHLSMSSILSQCCEQGANGTSPKEHREAIDKNTKSHSQKKKLAVQKEKDMKIISNKHDDEKTKLYYYLLDSTPLIDEYKNLLIQPIKTSFMSKKNAEEDKNNNTRQRTIELENQFIQIASCYINIEKYIQESEKYIPGSGTGKNIRKNKNLPFNSNSYNLPISKTSAQCANNTCKNRNPNMFVLTEEKMAICLLCGYETRRNSKITVLPYAKVKAQPTSHTYERRIHFRDCINQYQGKQNTIIPLKVYEDLENEFKKIGMVIGPLKINDEKSLSSSSMSVTFLETSQKDNSKLSSKGIEFDTQSNIIQKNHMITKDHVFLFLKETGNNKYYDDVHLIHYKLTGLPPNDISHLEQQLMSDFDKLLEAYENLCITGDQLERKSFVNTQYVLYHLLRRHKHPCSRHQFQFLKTLDRKAVHDDILSRIFGMLGWTYNI